MKTNKFTLLLLLLFAFCFFSCEKMPTADTTEIPTDTTEIIIPEIYPKVIETINYFLPDSSNTWIVMSPWDKILQYIGHAYLYAFNSQVELSAVLQDKQNLPVIDFDKYTLIRLKTDWSTENNVSYSYIQTGEKSYTVEVEITGLPALPRPPYTPLMGFVLTNFLVPKLPEDATFELSVIRNMNLDGWNVAKYYVDVEAIVVKRCYDMYAITDSFSIAISDYGGVFAYNHVPEEYQIFGLPVIVSGKRYSHPTINKCIYTDYPPGGVIIEPYPTYMFHIDSIKPKPAEP